MKSKDKYESALNYMADKIDLAPIPTSYAIAIENGIHAGEILNGKYEVLEEVKFDEPADSSLFPGIEFVSNVFKAVRTSDRTEKKACVKIVYHLDAKKWDCILILSEDQSGVKTIESLRWSD